MKLPLLGQTGGEREDDVSYQLTKNWYPHVNQESKSSMIHYPTLGLTEFVLIDATGPVRGMLEYGNGLYVVTNNQLYKVTATLGKTLLGTLTTNVGRVSMAHNGSNNGKQILIVDGENGYIYDSDAETFTRLSVFDEFHGSGSDLEPTHCAFMDSYFIINDPTNSGRFYISGSYDGTSWDSLDFATAERNPDELQALVVSNLSLFLVGTKTTEVWYNTGDADFPFAPIQSGFSQHGTVAKYSVVETGGVVLYLSQNEQGAGQVLMNSGGTVTIVSTVGIAAEISKLTDLTNAYAYSYQYQQHTFYVLTFPSDRRTFVYDLSTQLWHEWGTESTGYHRSSCHVYIYGKHMVGDPMSGRVFYLDENSYTDNGETIRRIRRSAGINAEDEAIRHYAVHVDIKEGVGNDDCDDPQIGLRWRDNNGKWSNYYWRSMGKIGENQKKTVWRRLGRSYERVYEISVSDPVNAVLIDAYGVVSGDSREIG